MLGLGLLRNGANELKVNWYFIIEAFDQLEHSTPLRWIGQKRLERTSQRFRDEESGLGCFEVLGPSFGDESRKRSATGQSFPLGGADANR
jgi:hypothetical protein